MFNIFFVMAAMVLMIHAANYCMKEEDLTDDKFYDELQTNLFKNQQHRVVELECPDLKDNSTCLYIVDRIGYSGDGSWFVARFLTPVPSLTKGFLSVSLLSKPVFKTMSTVDTAVWPVDIGTMDALTPNAYELTSLFTSGHYPLSTEISGNITFLGVATGGLMSFLGMHFKNLNLTGIDINPQSEYLAKKWFGYKDRENSRILIGDGAEYIKEMARRGENSDAVLIDACHNIEPEDGIYCPVEALRTPEFLDSLSRVIGSKGITTFNLFNLYNKSGGYEKIWENFSQHFVDCHLTRNDIGNAFLMCSNYKLDRSKVDIPKTREFLRQLRIQGFMVRILASFL
ncbi:hypothetical protein GCK72_000699 [Caenorhabditis remanei]|uniref:Uncharacterized protein n=1 Tax=Caenorhabditis remanei TaxID=31234 RepID=A0A6A5HQD9_CAERE|nr:hypothetical protein GCK72_000699 [Caenorhabditis remanei]KAF1768886.1 hypothetical protein GCK72_000699 [Caenorhabditis remanei]